MEGICCLTPKRKSSQLDGRNYKICRENNALSIARMPTATAVAQPQIVAKRSARIANSMAKRNSRQAITNYFQLQTKLTTNLTNGSMHLQSDGMDTTDDSDPPIQDDDDNACDHFSSTFSQHHFRPFHVHQQNVTKRSDHQQSQQSVARVIPLPIEDDEDDDNDDDDDDGRGLQREEKVNVSLANNASAAHGKRG